jgi:hypothetical protein
MSDSVQFRVIAAIIGITVTPSFVHGNEGLWLDSRLHPLPTEKLGPFVRINNDDVLAIDESASYISSDHGQTWSPGRPLFPDEQNIRGSNERALFCTQSGVVIVAFMNLAARHWTWSDQLGDALEARLPTYVMRSVDGGKTWQDIQEMHNDCSGAVRDMIQKQDGRIIFTAMKLSHNPGRHSVLTYSSTDDCKSWTASNLIDLGGAGHHGGVTEPTLTELPDGRIWMLIRTNWGEFWSAYSHDGGQFWRVIHPSGVAASSAPGILRRLTSVGTDDGAGGKRAGRLVLIGNRPYPDGKTAWPLSGGDNRWSATPVSNHREELSMAFSEDDGKTWGEPVVIARRRDTNAVGSARWVAYPYLFETSPSELWITTMQGGLRARLKVPDFVQTRK